MRFEEDSEELEMVKSSIGEAARKVYKQDIKIDSFVEWALSNAVFYFAGCDSTLYADQKSFWNTLDVNTQIRLALVFERRFNQEMAVSAEIEDWLKTI